MQHFRRRNVIPPGGRRLCDASGLTDRLAGEGQNVASADQTHSRQVFHADFQFLDQGQCFATDPLARRGDQGRNLADPEAPRRFLGRDGLRLFGRRSSSGTAARNRRGPAHRSRWRSGDRRALERFGSRAAIRLGLNGGGRLDRVGQQAKRLIDRDVGLRLDQEFHVASLRRVHLDGRFAGLDHHQSSVDGHEVAVGRVQLDHGDHVVVDVFARSENFNVMIHEGTARGWRPRWQPGWVARVFPTGPTRGCNVRRRGNEPTPAVPALNCSCKPATISAPQPTKPQPSSTVNSRPLQRTDSASGARLAG